MLKLSVKALLAHLNETPAFDSGECSNFPTYSTPSGGLFTISKYAE
jgi:hypothetical protein